MFQKSLIPTLIFTLLILKIECKPRQKRETCSASTDLTQVPNDCSKFYRCANGILSVHECSPGLVFDNNYKVCNWPNQVSSCKTSYATPGCTAANDLTQVENDCSKFYRCSNGVLSVQSCSSGLLFDNNLKICNWPYKVTCIQKSTCDPALDLTQVTNDCSKFYRCLNGELTTNSCPTGYLFDKNAKACNPANQVTTCNSIPCTSSIDLTPVSGNCSQFYRCINGAQTILSCPVGYLFDRNQKACNPSNQVYCASGNCDSSVDLTPVPNDCSKFYKCINGALTSLTCPSGYLFDKNAKTCNPSSQVTCGTCDPAVDLTPVPNDCSKFYRCINGVLSTLTCPNGYLFDKFYRCINGVLSTLTCPNGYLFDKLAKTCNPSNQVACGTCNPEIDLTPVPNDCSKFYRCINGFQTTLTCPSGYLFDKNAKACNPSNQVTTCYSCANQHLTNVPGDCSRYYLCINNVLSTNNCPAETSFDLTYKNCRTTYLIDGKCGSNPFPGCSFSLSQESRIELCSQSGFRTDYPACC